MSNNTYTSNNDGKAFYDQVEKVGFTKALDNYTAVGIAEGFIEADDEQQIIDAWQHLHDTGLAYTLQGWFGRTAQNLIAQGIISE